MFRILVGFISILIILWLMVIIGYFKVIADPDNEFWEGIFFNLIYGIPLSVITSVASSWFFSEFTFKKKDKLAFKFYSKFQGKYKELKVIAGEKPTEEWEEIIIDQDGLNLKVNFQKRRYVPYDLRASLEIIGTLEQKRHFEVFYNQISANGIDGGYWGKYDIQLLDSGEVIGHKYHTSDKTDQDDRVNYIVTRIKWVRVEENVDFSEAAEETKGKH